MYMNFNWWRKGMAVGMLFIAGLASMATSELEKCSWEFAGDRVDTDDLVLDDTSPTKTYSVSIVVDTDNPPRDSKIFSSEVLIWANLVWAQPSEQRDSTTIKIVPKVDGLEIEPGSFDERVSLSVDFPESDWSFYFSLPYSEQWPSEQTLTIEFDWPFQEAGERVVIQWGIIASVGDSRLCEESEGTTVDIVVE